MAGDRHQIEPHRLDGERDLAEGLRRIGVEQDAAGAAQRADLGERLDHADLVMRRHHRNQEGAVRHRRGQPVEVDEAARLDRQIADREALALQRGGAFEHTFVLGRQHDQMVTNLAAGRRMGPREMSDALQRQIVRLGSTRGEHDLARIGVDQPRHLAARHFDRRHRVAAIDGALAVRVAEMLGEIGQHRFEHARVEWRRGLIVEIDRQRIRAFRKGGS